MPRSVATEPVKKLLIELPESEYNALESYCLERQETKRQVIRTLLKTVIRKQSRNKEK